jgi:hypothetical protein
MSAIIHDIKQGNEDKGNNWRRGNKQTNKKEKKKKVSQILSMS